MQKVGNTTDTADSNGEYTNGNVANGVSPTIINAEMLNTFQRELVNVVLGAGLTLEPSNYSQVLQAVKKLFLSRINPGSDIAADGNASVFCNNIGIPALLNQALNGYALKNGDSNTSFYVSNNGDATAAVNNTRLNYVLGNYANKGGDASQGFAVAGGNSPNSAVAFNQFLSGINGNGAWVRLPGGGQWCRKNLSIAANSTATWTYPMAFGSTPALLVSAFNGAPNVWFNGGSSSGANLFNGNSSDINVNVLAIW